jgi:hypothetical protein
MVGLVFFAEFRRASRKRFLAFGLAGFCCLAVGCRREEIRAYRVPKEEKTSTPPMAMAMANPHENSPGHITWTLPAGWKEEVPDSIKAASFSILASDGRMGQVFAIPLPLGGLTELDIVNVWRDEVGLPHLTKPEEIVEMTQTVPVDGSEGKLFDMTSPEGKEGLKSHIVSLIAPHNQVFWIFKMSGDAGLVGEQKSAFLEFLKSVKFHEAVDQQLAEMPSRVSSNSKKVPLQADLPKWETPQNWQAKPPGPMILAAFGVTAPTGTADVTISKLAGDGGGVVPNVNRWRGQLNLPPASSSEIMNTLKTFEVANSKASLVEISGTAAKTGKPAKMLAAIVPHEGQTWFYKLMGDGEVVEAQKDDFQKFIQSAYK